MQVFDCTLWEYFKISDVQKRPISMAVRFKIFEKILSGLKEIQNRGFRHLDIKPGNIMLKTVDSTKTGNWNEQDLVIIDFGVGGRNDQKTGLAGTPGFASPEQLIGDSHQKSDNFAFGKLMIMIFCDWPTSWNIMYQPVTKDERRNIRFPASFNMVVKRLLKVRIFQITGGILQGIRNIIVPCLLDGKLKISN